MSSIANALSKIIHPRKKDTSKLEDSFHHGEGEDQGEEHQTEQPREQGLGIKELDNIVTETPAESLHQSTMCQLPPDSEEQQAKYGTLPTEEHDPSLDTALEDITSRLEGSLVRFRARLHTSRAVSSGLAFLVFRQQTQTVQGVLATAPDLVSAQMVRWAERLPEETILQVKGIVQKPKKPIIGATVPDAEVLIRELHVVASLTTQPPFSVYENENSRAAAATGSESKFNVSERTRSDNRILELRTAAMQSVFRIQSTICGAFRGYLDTQDFIEIHTPKLQGGASESGASVFKLNYFGRPAFLAQSPQLFKQMSISADFQRVYEIGPVFRAENSNTHRHLTEYTGLDLEMMIQKDYYDVMNMIDGALKHIFEQVYAAKRAEIEILKKYFPHDDLVWLDKTPILKFSEGIDLLANSGYVDEQGSVPTTTDDLSTRAEIRLGELVKEKYHTDYFILDKFPANVRPFYAMPDRNDPSVTNSFDIFVRGQEIVTGGQRIHDAHMLEQNMIKNDVSGRGLEEYLDGFQLGMPPHGGCGVGLERLVMLLFDLKDIRHASMYPRDPKSLPQPPDVTKILPHPEASTLPKDIAKLKEAGKLESTSCMCSTVDLDKTSTDPQPHHPPLEKLIANYGDAANTSWLDDRYEIWRHPATGAAIGFVPSTHHFAMIIGNPLCDASQYLQIVPAFLQWLKNERKLKPVWLLVSEEMEQILGGKLGWSTLTCVGESRVELEGDIPRALQEKEVARKIRHAKGANVAISVHNVNHPMPQELKKACDDRILDWMHHKQGKQVRLTQVQPWKDELHRKYFVAQHKNEAGNEHIDALIVLAMLAPVNGWQVKYALDFPGSPGGAIELALAEAMKVTAASGSGRVTFGTSAMDRLVPRENISGLRVKILAHAYQAISDQLKLLNKGDFRSKLGAKEDPVYICYPHRRLGNRGAKSILDFFLAGEGGGEDMGQGSTNTEASSRASLVSADSASAISQ